MKMIAVALVTFASFASIERPLFLPKKVSAMPSIAPETTTPAKADQPVDIARIQELVARLILLLADNNFSAIAGFRELQKATAGTRLEQAIASVANPLEQLKFSTALTQLRRIAQAENWRLPS